MTVDQENAALLRIARRREAHELAQEVGFRAQNPNETLDAYEQALSDHIYKPAAQESV